MVRLFDLAARQALLAAVIARLLAIERLGQRDGSKPLADPFQSQEKIRTGKTIVHDGSLQEPDRSPMSDNLFETHRFAKSPLEQNAASLNLRGTII
jgi:hypothetical protein